MRVVFFAALASALVAPAAHAEPAYRIDVVGGGGIRSTSGPRPDAIGDVGFAASALFGPKHEKGETWRLGPSVRVTAQDSDSAFLVLGATAALLGKPSEVPTSLELSLGPALAIRGDGTHAAAAARFSFGAFGPREDALKLLSIRVFAEYRASFDGPGDALVLGVEMNPFAPIFLLGYALFAAGGSAPAMYGH